MDALNPETDAAQDELDPGLGALYQPIRHGWSWPDLFWWLR